MFDLEVGPQSHLIAVPRVGGFSGVASQDKVTSVARACKQLIPRTFVPTLKFCYDKADRTVYCLAANDQVAETYCAYSVLVGEVNVTFCKVSSIVMRKNSVTAYFDVDITVKVCFLILFPFLVSYESMLNILACFYYLSFSLYHFYIFILA